MDKDGRKPKTYVSTFRLALKPQNRPGSVGKQRENGLETTDRILSENKKLGVSSATGKVLKTVDKLILLNSV